MAIKTRTESVPTKPANDWVCEVGEFQGDPTIRVGPSENYKACLSGKVKKWLPLMGVDSDGDNILRMVVESILSNTDDSTIEGFAPNLDHFCIWWMGVRGEVATATATTPEPEPEKVEPTLEEKMAALAITYKVVEGVIFYHMAGKKVGVFMEGDLNLVPSLSEEATGLIEEHAADNAYLLEGMTEQVVEAIPEQKTVLMTEAEAADLRRRFQSQTRIWRTASEEERNWLVNDAFLSIGSGPGQTTWVKYRDLLGKFSSVRDFRLSAGN